MHHHSGLKFQLQYYKFVVEGDSGLIDLGIVPAEFREESTSHILTLPPQARKQSGKLKVGALYGDGRVEFGGPIRIDLPFYGKLSY
jgi:hypothetical protein